MAYEHQLKMLADGFENTSADFAAWAKFLDLRIDSYGYPAANHFKGAPHISPPASHLHAYDPIAVSMQNAAELMRDIADYQGWMVADVSNLGPAPNPPKAEAAMSKTLYEFDLVNLILSWQQVDIGIFKTLMRLYGLIPGDLPPRLHPGPGTDDRWGALIVSWLSVIDTDVQNFVNNQRFTKGNATPVTTASNLHDALVNFEEQYHRLVNNYLLLLTILPYHVFAAHP
jgi:hypothetical protein